MLLVINLPTPFLSANLCVLWLPNHPQYPPWSSTYLHTTRLTSTHCPSIGPRGPSSPLPKLVARRKSTSRLAFVGWIINVRSMDHKSFATNPLDGLGTWLYYLSSTKQNAIYVLACKGWRDVAHDQSGLFHKPKSVPPDQNFQTKHIPIRQPTSNNHLYDQPFSKIMSYCLLPPMICPQDFPSCQILRASQHPQATQACVRWCNSTSSTLIS